MLPITVLTNLSSLLKHKVVLYAILISGIVFCVYQGAYYKGKRDEKQHQLNHYNSLLVEHQQKALSLQKEVDELKSDYRVKQEEALRAYEKGKEDAERQTDKLLADLRTQSKRLSIEVRPNRNTCTHDKSTRHTSHTQRASRAELSEASARFLINEANRADEIARRYNLCQNILTETRDLFQMYQDAVQKKNKK